MAHTEVAGTTPLELYRTTALGSEVDNLDDPHGGPEGFEYFPWVYDPRIDTHPNPYPYQVKWKFDEGDETARKCMKLSWHV